METMNLPTLELNSQSPAEPSARLEMNESSRAKSEAATIIEELRHFPLFAYLDAENPACRQFVERGEIVHFAAGDRVVGEGDPAAFFVLLEGEIQVRKVVAGSEMLLTTHQRGNYFGELPMLLETGFLASGWCSTPCRVLRLDRDGFWLLLGACPTVMRAVLGTMAKRVQALETVGQGQEKLASLGTMAAGLAHELNNPAAAASRAAKHLREEVKRVQLYACHLGSAGLETHQREYLATLQGEVLEQVSCRNRCSVELDPLTRSDREEEVGDWLTGHAVEEAWDLAPPLVNAGLDTAWLDRVATQLPEPVLPLVMQWITAAIAVAGLLNEMDDSTYRISKLVKAVKSYSFMDRAPQQRIDIHDGLEDTLTMLGHKLKSFQVLREFDREIPPVCAFGSELNQVWTNLLDNAADAMNGKGKIQIRTAREGDTVLVEITDDGPGVPPEVQKRIFEPFFTTKGVGKGTGLGLSTSHRIVVGRHHGEIRLLSEPGNTRFQVRLPIDGPDQNSSCSLAAK